MERERVRDLVVVVPGIMGSALAKDGTDVWNLSRQATWQILKSRLGCLHRLALPADLGDDHPRDGVEPVDVMRTLHGIPGLGPLVVGYDGLLRWLRRNFTLDPSDGDHPGNLWAFAYDWRLSIRYNARRLAAELPPRLERWQKASKDNKDARVVFLCHSMGGLVARYYLEVCGGAELCRALITLGTPYRGSLDALSRLVNGVSFKLGGIGPDLTRLARSLPSLHQLTPRYACLDDGGELKYPQELGYGLPGVDAALLADAARLHQEIADKVKARGGSPSYQILPFRGLRQPTLTTASLDERGRLVGSFLIDGEDEGGDGRVPRLSAFPPEMRDTDLVIRGVVEGHGALPAHRPIRAELFQFFTGREKVHRAPVDAADRLRVQVPELVAAGEPVPLEVTADGEGPVDRLALTAVFTPSLAGGRAVTRSLANRGGGRYTAVVRGLDPGLYSVSIKAATGGEPVTRHLTVWDADE